MWLKKYGKLNCVLQFLQKRMYKRDKTVQRSRQVHVQNEQFKLKFNFLIQLKPKHTDS